MKLRSHLALALAVSLIAVLPMLLGGVFGFMLGVLFLLAAGEQFSFAATHKAVK
jgi:hypothetical protein